jgi:hypothetical protein
MSFSPRGAWTLAVMAGVFLCMLGLLVLGAVATGPCGDVGGSPRAVPASPRGQFCGAPSFLTAVVGPPALSLVGAAFAIKVGRWAPLALGCLVGALLAFGSLPVAEQLSPD